MRSIKFVVGVAFAMTFAFAAHAKNFANQSSKYYDVHLSDELCVYSGPDYSGQKLCASKSDIGSGIVKAPSEVDNKIVSMKVPVGCYVRVWDKAPVSKSKRFFVVENIPNLAVHQFSSSQSADQSISAIQLICSNAIKDKHVKGLSASSYKRYAGLVNQGKPSGWNSLHQACFFEDSNYQGLAKCVRVKRNRVPVRFNLGSLGLSSLVLPPNCEVKLDPVQNIRVSPGRFRPSYSANIPATTYHRSVSNFAVLGRSGLFAVGFNDRFKSGEVKCN